MKVITLFSCLFLALSLHANDGVYYNSGGIFYPTDETRISMATEVLSFKIENLRAYVNVEFEFYNPDPEARTLLVGFQVPSPSGDVSDSISNTCHISDFMVMQNDKILRHQLQIAECDSCELQEPGSFEFSQYEQGFYVYLFRITFQPGKNIVKHSYNVPASTGVDFEQLYDYIITTGAKWADGKINAFTLNIDMGSNTYFMVEDVFGETAQWTVNGVGRIGLSRQGYSEDYDMTMVRLISGELQIKVEEFHPEANISFGVWNHHRYICWPLTDVMLSPDHLIEEDVIQELSQFSKDELRILRNTIYAHYGYNFHSKDLKDYFEKFDWYIPNPNLEFLDIALTPEEIRFIEILKKLE